MVAQFPYIDDVNIRLTGVAFPGNRIFTLSTFGSARQERGVSAGASNIAIATRFRDPGHPQPPEPGSRAAGSSPRRAGRNVATATHWPFTEMVVNSLITNLYRCANVPALDRYLPRN